MTSGNLLDTVNSFFPHFLKRSQRIYFPTGGGGRGSLWELKEMCFEDHEKRPRLNTLLSMKSAFWNVWRQIQSWGQGWMTAETRVGTRFEERMKDEKLQEQSGDGLCLCCHALKTWSVAAAGQTRICLKWGMTGKSWTQEARRVGEQEVGWGEGKVEGFLYPFSQWLQECTTYGRDNKGKLMLILWRKEGRKDKEKAFKESLKERICLINNSCSERILCRRDVDE